MNEVILIKYGEMSLKGLNRSTFEDILIRNIKEKLASLGSFEIKKSQSAMVITPLNDEADLDGAVSKIGKVFGIAAFSKAAVCEKDIVQIKNAACKYLGDSLMSAKTFKVTAKRADKKFPLASPEICAELGQHILSETDKIKVDLHNPELTVTVEIREKGAYIHGKQLAGAGGLPSGTGGRACILISGGIDSPVAAFMLAKRGVRLTAVHFASPPYTSPLAEMKVHELLGKTAEYSGNINLFTVPFTKLQEAVRDYCPEEMFTVTMRRIMMRIASKIALWQGCGALITGESLGQVASQTLQAIGCTDECASLPVFRPLIGMDKNDIVAVARKIETFDISIKPYEDCCTVFTPRRPKIRPDREYARKVEEMIPDEERMIEEAVKEAKLTVIK